MLLLTESSLVVAVVLLPVTEWYDRSIRPEMVTVD